jgi:hypothetical protein
MRALAMLLVLAACSDDEGAPITEITSPRILAIVSEPSALPYDGSIRLSPVAVDPAGPRTGDVAQVRACSPWRFIAEPAIDCAGADALPLVADADGAFTVSTEQLLEAFPPPQGTANVETLRLALEAGVDLRIPVIAEIPIDGTTLIARRDLHVVLDAEILANPRLVEVRFDGADLRTLRAGQRYALTLLFDPESFDDVPRDPEDPRPPELEEFDCYFYSPHGELDAHERDVDDPEEAAFETEPNAYTAGEPGDTWMFLVATDSTGGMSVDAIPLVIE